MKSTLAFIQKNRAFSITMANLILFALAILINDPFDLFQSTYSKAKPFFTVAREQIDTIKISKTANADSGFTLKKKGENWLVVRTIEHPADEEKITQLLKAIVDARKYTIATRSKKKASEYGFGGGDEIKLEVFVGKESKGYLLLGSLSSPGNYSHARWQEEDAIYIIEDNLKSKAGHGKFDDFVQKKLIPADAKSEDLQTIEWFVDGKQTYQLVKNGKKWQQKTPEAKDIAEEKMNSLVSNAVNLSASGVVEGEEYKAKMQPMISTLKISLTYKKTPVAVTIKILGQDKDSKSYYVQKDNFPTIFQLSEYQLKPFFEWQQ